MDEMISKSDRDSSYFGRPIIWIFGSKIKQYHGMSIVLFCANCPHV